MQLFDQISVRLWPKLKARYLRAHPEQAEQGGLMAGYEGYSDELEREEELENNGVEDFFDDNNSKDFARRSLAMSHIIGGEVDPGE